MEAEILEELVDFYHTLQDLLWAQDEERLRWQGSSREAENFDFDTLGSDVRLEQFRYGVHGLYWIAILTV